MGVWVQPLCESDNAAFTRALFLRYSQSWTGLKVWQHTDRIIAEIDQEGRACSLHAWCDE